MRRHRPSTTCQTGIHIPRQREYRERGGQGSDHVAIGLAHADHGSGAQHVQDQLRGRAGLQSRTAGDDFRARQRRDHEVDMARETHGGRVRAGDADGQAAQPFRVREAAEDVRRSTGRRDADQAVAIRIRTQILQILFPGLDAVLGALLGFSDGRIPAGDHADELREWRRKGGRDFRCIEDSESIFRIKIMLMVGLYYIYQTDRPSAGARADVDDSSAQTHARNQCVDGLGDDGQTRCDAARD